MNLIQTCQELMRYVNSLPRLAPDAYFINSSTAVMNLSAAGFKIKINDLEIGYQIEGVPLEAELGRLQDIVREGTASYSQAELARRVEARTGKKMTNISTWRRGMSDLGLETLMIVAEETMTDTPEYTIRPFSFSYP